MTVTLPRSAPSWPELADTTAIGFRGLDAVEVAASMWPAVPAGRLDQLPEAVTDGAPVERSLIIAPGVITFRVRDPRTADGPDDLDDDEDQADARGVVTEFSAGSRRRLGRTIASLDWADALAAGGRLCMITLTYPGDWERSAPDPATVKAHLDAFAKRWNRAMREPMRAVWAREFQRRGAPHLHLLAVADLVTPKGEPLTRWVSRAWYEVVGSSDRRHLAAGTRLDWSEGLRMSDVNRAAAYFAGYASLGKGYQHEAPEGWHNDNGSVGRWWGVIGLRECSTEVRVTARDLTRAKRILRGLQRSQKRVVCRRVRRVDRQTGEIRYRNAMRRYRLRSLKGGAGAGCSFFANDGAALAVALARALDDDPDPWPGGPRPLP